VSEHTNQHATPATASPEAAAGRAAAATNGRHDARLVIENVSHDYITKKERIHALDPVSLAFDPGDFVSLAGPSGCGKSTLLSLLAGFIFPTEGEITFGGRRIEQPGWERGVVFQQPNLYPWLSVRDNVTFGPRMRGLKKSEYQARADHFLEMVGLADFASRRPYELSGGMQQRAAIARVLVNDPAIMLMDEPFGALDALTRERMQEELLAIWRETGKTIFFITHSVEEAVYLGTRVLVMSPRPGRIVFEEPSPFSRMETSVHEARALPEFVEMEKKVANAIYAGH
jgi:taurine transport system ATP-binding protein